MRFPFSLLKERKRKTDGTFNLLYITPVPQLFYRMRFTILKP